MRASRNLVVSSSRHRNLTMRNSSGYVPTLYDHAKLWTLCLVLSILLWSTFQTIFPSMASAITTSKLISNIEIDKSFCSAHKNIMNCDVKLQSALEIINSHCSKYKSVHQACVGTTGRQYCENHANNLEGCIFSILKGEFVDLN
jgi:hypothetical protein